MENLWAWCLHLQQTIKTMTRKLSTSDSSEERYQIYNPGTPDWVESLKRKISWALRLKGPYTTLRAEAPSSERRVPWEPGAYDLGENLKLQASMSTSGQERKTRRTVKERTEHRSVSRLLIKQKAAATKLKWGWWFRRQVPRALWRRKPGISAISQCLEQL